MAVRLILVSGSPRRRELLAGMGISFEVEEAGIDEAAQGDPRDVTVALARRKAEAALARHRDALVLAADTLVTIGGETLGKPADAEDARRMLRLLQGRWHEVHTGVCLLICADAEARCGHAMTQVCFDPMDEAQIRAYVDSGEPFGKAGAYAIQGLAGMFIPRIRGSYSNVVGLPTALVREMLEQAAPGIFPWGRF